MPWMPTDPLRRAGGARGVDDVGGVLRVEVDGGGACGLRRDGGGLGIEAHDAVQVA